MKGNVIKLSSLNTVNVIFPKYRWCSYFLIWRGSRALGSLNRMPTEIELYSLQLWSHTQITFSSSYGNKEAKCLTITKQIVPETTTQWTFQVQYVQKWAQTKTRTEACFQVFRNSEELGSCSLKIIFWKKACAHAHRLILNTMNICRHCNFTWPCLWIAISHFCRSFLFFCSVLT